MRPLSWRLWRTGDSNRELLSHFLFYLGLFFFFREWLFLVLFFLFLLLLLPGVRVFCHWYRIIPPASMWFLFYLVGMEPGNRFLVMLLGSNDCETKIHFSGLLKISTCLESKINDVLYVATDSSVR
ncbi:hypothetical protein BGZ63DRAFT_48947 [Mariannaea sp. PMI_226]|nr:hypothetical protein BGZ63DRAFT_48947 [Mariannaea sp. PMI_226]